jgi:hypothetical protein
LTKLNQQPPPLFRQYHLDRTLRHDASIRQLDHLSAQLKCLRHIVGHREHAKVLRRGPGLKIEHQVGAKTRIKAGEWFV